MARPTLLQQLDRLRWNARRLLRELVWIVTDVLCWAFVVITTPEVLVSLGTLWLLVAVMKGWIR